MSKDPDGPQPRRGDKVFGFFDGLRDSGVRPNFGKKFESPNGRRPRGKRCVACRKGKVVDDALGNYSHCENCGAAYERNSSKSKAPEAGADIPCVVCNSELVAPAQGKYLFCPECRLLYLKDRQDIG
ncbi:MAG: hypothetical protein HYS59_00890 [Candidatus Vogelbacteria bacterium]|nr:hypothetical protein [Candidatus Vogelbacteria bacterium]